MRSSSRLPRRLLASAAVVLAALGLLGHVASLRVAAFPEEISIASGQPAGRFRQLAGILDETIERSLGVRVTVVETAGSMQNLEMLHRGQVDFALSLSQVGRLAALQRDAPNARRFPRDVLTSGNVTFVASLERQPAHLMVRRSAGVVDLRGRRVSIGLEGSGSGVVGLALLEHLGLEPGTVHAERFSHQEVVRSFADGSLDAALVFGGVHALLPTIVETDRRVLLVDVPFAEAFVAKHVGFERYRIPAGTYRKGDLAIPPEAIESVSLRAQLLAHRDTSPGLVEAVAAIATGEEVMARANLTELFARGRSFASEAPDYPMHPGAKRLYEPALRPLLPADFMESTEAMRSFLVSLGIALYVAYRWIRSRREHRLERYFRELKRLERELRETPPRLYLPDGSAPPAPASEAQGRVLALRDAMLRNSSVRELNAEPAIACFVDWCDRLAARIPAERTPGAAASPRP